MVDMCNIVAFIYPITLITDRENANAIETAVIFGYYPPVLVENQIEQEIPALWKTFWNINNLSFSQQLINSGNRSRGRSFKMIVNENERPYVSPLEVIKHELESFKIIIPG